MPVSDISHHHDRSLQAGIESDRSYLGRSPEESPSSTVISGRLLSFILMTLNTAKYEDGMLCENGLRESEHADNALHAS